METRADPATWRSAAWRETASAWIDEALRPHGLTRTGPVTQPHVRPWSTVLRAPTDGGVVWLKATSRWTASEVPLTERLAAAVPEQVLVPLATDRARSWLLLPDGGTSLGERADGVDVLDGMAAALTTYGQLQRRVAIHAHELVAAGVMDARPGALATRFDEAVAVVAGQAPAADDDVLARVRAERPRIVAAAEQLATSPLPGTVDHQDLHPWNVLGGPAGPRFYDWGDAVVAHPFASALVPLGFVRDQLDAAPDDPRLLRVRDAYLDAFTDLAPHRELVATLELAARLAKVARTLTWDRALRAARETDEPVDEAFARAPRATLSSLLDAFHLGGA